MNRIRFLPNTKDYKRINNRYSIFKFFDRNCGAYLIDSGILVIMNFFIRADLENSLNYKWMKRLLILNNLNENSSEYSISITKDNFFCYITSFDDKKTPKQISKELILQNSIMNFFEVQLYPDIKGYKHKNTSNSLIKVQLLG